jgi:hypothetical protein
MARETASGKYYYRNTTPITAAPYTISAWAYTTSATTNQNAFVINRAGDGGNSLGLTLKGGSGGPLDFFSAQSGSTSTAFTSNAFTVNAWNHCCGVASSSTNRTSYLNGNTASKGTSTTSSVPASLDRVTIGVFFGSGTGDPLIGGVCECALWNVALNESEVVSLSKGISADKIRPQSLVFYFPGIREVIDRKDSSAITSVGAPGVIAHPRIY